MHFNDLTDAEAARLNGPDGGWDSEPKFSRFANVRMNADAKDVREAFEKGEYNIIADLEVVDLDDAFEKSNHIADDWTKNKEVTSMSSDRARSTSVGDILADPDSGEYFIVKPAGFEKIELY